MSTQESESRDTRILLVEDTLAHAELIIRGLERSGIRSEVVHVTDGEKALDYIFNRGEFGDADDFPRPDFVLLDLRLPKVDGLGVLRQVRETESIDTLPVVILTTSSSDSDMKKAYQLHANSFLIKPLDFASFNSLIKELGHYWLHRNQRPACS